MMRRPGATSGIARGSRDRARPRRLAQSKVTAQGQTSVPVEVRRKLGIGPGAILEWDEDGDKIVVRKAGRYSSAEVHRALFPRGAPASRTLDELKAGIRRYIRKKHARR